jgi:hypothetical protein
MELLTLPFQPIQAVEVAFLPVLIPCLGFAASRHCRPKGSQMFRRSIFPCHRSTECGLGLRVRRIVVKLVTPAMPASSIIQRDIRIRLRKDQPSGRILTTT